MLLLPLLAALTLAPADTVRLVLVATTDLHGHVTDWDYVNNRPAPGGLARAATVVDSLRERYPGQVILVDAGDALQGTAFAAYYGNVNPRDPHPVIDAMNTLGYDAATPGNHEFDFGTALFERAIAAATFPMVSANLRRLPTDSLALPPFVVIRRNGVRIAIAGLLTPGTMVWHRDRVRGRYRVTRLAEAAPAVLREMRREADLAIVLSHSGLDGSGSYDTTGVGPEDGALILARGSDRPDVVVVGHSHGELRDSVIGGVHFIQPRPRAQALAVLHLTLVTRGERLALVHAEGESIALEAARPSARFLRRLADPHALALNWAVGVVAESRGGFQAAQARVEDTPFVRLIHEVQRRATGAALSMTPVFEPRAGFGEGEITMGEVFRAYPYENTLRAVKLSGADLRAWLEHSARYFTRDSAGHVALNRRIPGYNFDLLGGATYTIDLARPVGSRVTRLEVRGRPVAPEDSFTVAVADYRQQGGGGFPRLSRLPVVYDKGENIRDLIVAELRRRRVLVAPDSFTPAWNLAPAALASQARELFQEARPAPVAPAGPAVAILPAPPTPERSEAGGPIVTRDSGRAEPAVATLRLPAEAGAGRGLARLAADAYRNVLRADVGLVATTELGGRLAAGPVSGADLAAALPGAGALLAIRMSGAELRELVENLVSTDSPCCELAGLRVKYQPRRRPWDRVRDVEFTNGSDIDRKRTYLVALSPALLDGDSVFPLGASTCREGQGCRNPGTLRRWPVVRSTRLPAEALGEYLKALPQPVTPPEDRRLLPDR
jgi:2',3'-cyclic-nucleotide 2'-phosphodiesterase (5'-nucleotidase family)